MAKVAVYFKSVQADLDTNFHARGIYRDNRLQFYDQSQNHHDIYFDGDVIRYKKTGESQMDFVFEKGRIHNGIYKIAGNEMHFEIKTFKLVHNAHRIEVSYQLLQANEVVNTVRFKIEISFLKEGNNG